MTEQTPQFPDITPADGKMKVWTLTIPHICFMRTVIILASGREFRLLASDGAQIHVDASYYSLRGAKIAFQRFFSPYLRKFAIPNPWTAAYPAEELWVSSIMALPRIKNRFSAGSHSDNIQAVLPPLKVERKNTARGMGKE